jgi:hypothetical protein
MGLLLFMFFRKANYKRENRKRQHTAEIRRKKMLPPAARGSFYKNRPWTPQKFFISILVWHQNTLIKNPGKS